MSWQLRTERGLLAVQKLRVHRRYLTLLAAKPGDQPVSYHVPRQLPDESQAAWVGRAANLVSLYRALESVHPLIPLGGARAWARSPAGGPWVPAHGVYAPVGTSLEQLAQEGRLRLEHFWNTVPAVIEMLRAAQRRGLLLERLGPDEVLVYEDRPVAVLAPDHWIAATPGMQHDATRVAADFIHWFLCALRQTPDGREFPPTLWAICARGLEGIYARTGLFKLAEDLTAVAHRPLFAPDTPVQRACLCVDIPAVQRATGAYLDPWLTLEAVSEPGRLFEPLVALHDDPVPSVLGERLRDARFVLQSVPERTAQKLAAAIHQLAGPGRVVQLITGAPEDAAGLSAELERWGHPCEVIAFRGGNDGRDPERSRLRPALFLARNGFLESEGGGMSGASVELAANGNQ